MTEVPRIRKLKSISDEQLCFLGGFRPRRMSVVPVRITANLLARIRARGIPVSQFLREAGQKALDALAAEPAE